MASVRASVRGLTKIGVALCVLTWAGTLSGCAGNKIFGESVLFGKKDKEAAKAEGEDAMAAPAAQAAAPITAAPLDPLNAPPPAASAAKPDPLLVPAPGAALPSPQTQASQRVPLGSLGQAAAAPPTAITTPAAKRAPQPAAAPAAPAMAPEPKMAEAKPADPREFTPETAPAPRKPPAARVVTPANNPRKPLMVEAFSDQKAPETAAPVMQPPAKPASPAPAPMKKSGDQETVIISSANAPPVSPQMREFVPAPVVPDPRTIVPLGPGEVTLTTAQKNVVRRFETLKRLEQEELITAEEYSKRRNANIGALLAYTRDPGGMGLERSVPNADAISARLAALRRAFEMRAITPQQHALERTMIINALLPEIPDERAPKRPPPKDVIEAAAAIGFIEGLRADGMITEAEFSGEKNAIETVLRTGLLPSQMPNKGEKKVASAAKPAAAAPASAAADPLAVEITGPVLHLGSFASEASARKAWDEYMGRNKAILSPLKLILRKVDLGADKGIFFRVIAGMFPSMTDAEAACMQLKQNNQFCRASADGS